MCLHIMRANLHCLGNGMRFAPWLQPDQWSGARYHRPDHVPDRDDEGGGPGLVLPKAVAPLVKHTIPVIVIDEGDQLKRKHAEEQ